MKKGAHQSGLGRLPEAGESEEADPALSLWEDKALLTLILAQRHVGGASDLHNGKTIDPCCLQS